MQYLIRMFYVEHSLLSQFYRFVFVWLLFLAFSCKKQLDPNPELKDPIYTAFTAELANARVELTAAQSEVDSLKNDLKNAVPQSGEARVYERRVNDAQDKKAVAEQKVRYLEIKLEERKLVAQKKYLESQLPNGKPWPDEDEIHSELEKIRLVKERVQRVNGTTKIKNPNVPHGTPEKTAPANQGEAAPAH